MMPMIPWFMKTRQYNIIEYQVTKALGEIWMKSDHEKRGRQNYWRCLRRLGVN